jgi:hypothetical protein
MNQSQYAVYFHPLGYYAKNQRRQWEWQFTKNLSEALIYQKLKSAQDKVEHGLGLIKQYKNYPQPGRKEIISQTEYVEIKQLQVETIIKEVSVEKSYQLLDNAEESIPATNEGWFTKPEDR